MFAPAYMGRKIRANLDFLYLALDRTARAAFFKESRMKCAEATNLHRKSGRSPTIALPNQPRPARTSAK